MNAKKEQGNSNRGFNAYMCEIYSIYISFFIDITLST
jgi:hypothetical protein